jgi:integrase
VTIAGTVAEARAERRRLMAEGRPAAAVAVEPGTLDELAALYFRAKAPALAPSTVKAYDEAYRHRVSPGLGALDLTAITRERVEVWLAGLSSGSSPHAIRKAVAALRAILKTAAEWGRIPSNPAAGLRLPKVDPARPASGRVLGAPELRALYAATDRARVETMLRVAGEAGLRLGEVVGLRWPDVDLAGCRVTVERSVWQEAGRAGWPPTRIVKRPKSGRSRRVAISAEFAARLADWYARSVVEGGADATGYVWPGRAGGPMDASTPGQTLGRVLERAGLVDDDARP